MKSLRKKEVTFLKCAHKKYTRTKRAIHSRSKVIKITELRGVQIHDAASSTKTFSKKFIYFHVETHLTKSWFKPKLFANKVKKVKYTQSKQHCKLIVKLRF